MATKIKGLCKGFKQISQIFVVKDHGEMEIGYPTDVKHVAHIGLDGPSGAAPSWMNGFKSGPKFSATSDGNKGEQRDSIPISHSPWASQAQDSDQSIGHELVGVKDIKPKKLGIAPKKHKRRNTKSSSSSSSPSSPSTSKSS